VMTTAAMMKTPEAETSKPKGEKVKR